VNELDQVLDAVAAGDGEGLALATVVAAQGSTYRRPGARLVVGAGGETVGNVSGGCLEAEVIDTAGQVLATGRPRMLRFDLGAEAGAPWGWGLGCNGVIEVLVEPVSPDRAWVRALRAARRQDRAVAVVTVLEGDRLGSRLVVHPGGTTEGDLGHPATNEAARRHGLDALAQGSRRTSTLGAGPRVFVEALPPPLRLVVCGAGPDAEPLVAAGASLGWRVEVVDDRPRRLAAGRFPEARRLVHSQPAGVTEAVAVDARTYAVVMSHDFWRDQGYLRSLLNSPVAYLGVLGPRARLDQLLAALAADGIHPRPGARERVHGPAGLDLGAEGPGEIAWSIATEILAVSRGAGAGFLGRGRGRISPGPEPAPPGGIPAAPGP